jgi:RimJ/RimL family protein N-acetyltransferase
MKIAVQRRNILLAPPTDDDLVWIVRQFDDPAIYEMFGFDETGLAGLRRGLRRRQVVVGVLHLVEPQKRIGFVLMFPPVEVDHPDCWEFGYAIPEAADRDAFSALSATDAMAYYMFEQLGVGGMSWRTRSDNRAAAAVIRRLGYQAAEEREIDGHRYTLYRLTRAGWNERRAKLDRGEAQHPSAAGATFSILPCPALG